MPAFDPTKANVSVQQISNPSPRGVTTGRTRKRGTRMYVEVEIGPQDSVDHGVRQQYQGGLPKPHDHVMLMLKTRGLACAGAESKKLPSARGIALRSETVNVIPVSSWATFAPVVEPYGGYMRVTVLDPCLPAATSANMASNRRGLKQTEATSIASTTKAVGSNPLPTAFCNLLSAIIIWLERFGYGAGLYSRRFGLKR